MWLQNCGGGLRRCWELYGEKIIITQRFYLQKAVLERILGGNKNMSSFYGHSAILLQQEHAFNSLLKSLLGYNMDFKTSLC